MMYHADCMIGNSSSGIIEAPTLNLPVINLGKRQDGRLRSKNIVDSSFKILDLRKNISKFLKNRRKIKNINIYYKKKSLDNIIKLLNKDYL